MKGTGCCTSFSTIHAGEWARSVTRASILTASQMFLVLVPFPCYLVSRRDIDHVHVSHLMMRTVAWR